MKKYLILGLLIAILAFSAVFVFGDIPQPNRLIAPTTSAVDKAIFKSKGCKIIHELNDATALKCPKGVKIKGARPDKIYRLLDLQADQQINADDVWDLGYDGTDAKVAILDTGVDMNHQELNDSYLYGKDFFYGDDYPEDDHGHGTHCSGIVTANGVDPNAKGVAPGAGIIVGKVCGNDPIYGYGCWDSDIEAGIEWAVGEGADVISMSLGSYEVYAGSDCDWANDPVAVKSNWAVGEGVTVVAASGNDGLKGVSSPGCASEVIAVGAVNSRDKMASFTNFGEALDLLAPGVGIYSSLPGNSYDSWDGTSMATPHVAGTVALLLDKNPLLTVDEIKSALYNTAKHIKGKQGSAHGRVDALGAVNYVNEVCTNDADCNDGESCTVDVCNAGVCENTWPACGLTDGCCGPTCDSGNDPDCPTEVCGDGYCAGSANGEDCFTCQADCRGTGKDNSKSCCGDGVCSGEKAKNCPIDCI